MEKPEEEDDGNTKREAEKSLGVLPVGSPDLGRTNGTPKDGGSKEGVDTGASKAELGIRGAYAVNVTHLEVEHTDTDERANEGGDHLSAEGVSGRNLDVVGELKVVGEPDGVSAGDITEGLEVVHGEGVSFDERTTNELGEDIQSDFDTGHSLDDTDGNDKDEAEGQTIEDDPRRGVGLPAHDTSDTKTNGDDEAGHVPPLRHLGVASHEAVVDVEHGFVSGRGLLSAHAVP